MAEHLTLLTFNIQHGLGMDGKLDLERQASVIRTLKPDCVALQEVDVNVPRSGNVDEAAEFARLTGMQCTFGKAINFQGGEYGIAILTARPHTLAFHIPLPGAEPRTLLGVDTTGANGTPFRFVCSHFDLVEENKVVSAGIVTENLLASPLPCAFMGDLNCLPDSVTYRALKEKLAYVPTPGGTHPASAPRICIDHCFLAPVKRWGLASAEVVADNVASDHRPVLVKITLY